MTGTVEGLLAEFNRLGWALSGLGQHRDYKGRAEPRLWFWSVYPAIFGGEVWSDRGTKGSYTRALKTVTVTAETAVEAGEKCLKLLLDTSDYKLYSELQRAFQDAIDVRTGTDGRTSSSSDGEEAGLDSL